MTGSRTSLKGPWLILAIGLVSTLAVTALYRRLVEEKDAERFDNSVQQVFDTVSDRFAAYQVILRGAVGLYAASDSVEAREFEAYVRELEIARRFPGVQGIGFAERVRAQDLDSFTRRMRAQPGREAYEIRSLSEPQPDGDGAELFPITQIEPPDRRNLIAFGYDMFSEPARRRAMELARDTGQLQATPPLLLVQEIDTEQQMGFLLYLPVYARSEASVDPAGVEERRERLAGFVFAPFRCDDLLDGLFGSEAHPRLDVEVFDGDPTDPANRLGSSQPAQAGYEPTRRGRRSFELGGRTWTFAFATRPDFELASGAYAIPLLFLAGVVISGVLFGIARSQARARVEAEQHAASWRRAEERFATTLASIGDGVIATDRAGRITFLNPIAETLTAWPSHEAVGRDSAEVFRLVDEVERTPRPSPVERALREDRIVHLPRRTLLVRRDGGEVAIEDSAAPIRGTVGELEGIVLVFRDVSERRRVEAELAAHRERLEELVLERTVELERSHQALRLSERMASLGTLSAGLGHDMGNLLLPVRIRLDALAASDLAPAQRAEIEVIQKCVEYLQRLSNGLRLFALDPGEDALGGETTDVAAWWLDAEPFFKSVLPRGVVFEARFPAGLPHVRIAVHALTQAVFNLVQNAGEVMRARGRGHLLVWARHDASGAADTRDGAGRIVVGVTDDGPGMTPEVRQRCLEPFFTTKTREISTGLGLALVHGIVQKAGGRLAVESEVGRGTTFTLDLAAAHDAAARAGDAGSATPVAVVDVGDPRIASFAANELRVEGFDIRAAEGTDEPRILVGDGQRLDAHALAKFLASDPQCGALVFGKIAGAPEDGRVIVLPRLLKPTAIREAIRKLARAGARS